MDAFTAQLQCAICLCAYDKPMSLPCNHCFCEECIHRALELKPVCPICKAPAKKRRLRYDTMIQQLLSAVDQWTRHTPAPEPEPTPIVVAAPVAPVAQATKALETTPIRINPRIVEGAETGTGGSSVRRQGKKRKTAAAADAMKTTPTRRRLHTEDAEDSESKPTAPPQHQPIDSMGASTSTSTPSERFVVGQLVDVIDRTWRGVNKPGGAAWITAAHADGSYDVRYIIGTRREQRVPEMYVLLPKEEIVSFATPGTSVKQHRRKPRSSTGGSKSSGLQAAAVSPPPSAQTNGGDNAIGRDLVLAFSGFQEPDMPQLESWANAIGAQIATHWSPFVTHVLAKCATPQEIADSAAERTDDGGASGGSAAAAAAAAAASRKRALFKPAAPVERPRWVKIRSMKYLKALVSGRWIVSEKWLRGALGVFFWTETCDEWRRSRRLW
ncbi:hypothetical protein PINS_up010873 [Pythium insidiosum]|nr:hypothetical protein PINS_up010873 [Pythium insidiosum]